MIIIKTITPINYNNITYTHSVNVDNILVFIATTTKADYIQRKINTLDYSDNLITTLCKCL